MTTHSNCPHPATKAARSKCRRDRDIAPGFLRNMRIVNSRTDREAFHALESAIENGNDLHPTDDELAAVEAMNQYEGWLRNGRSW